MASGVRETARFRGGLCRGPIGHWRVVRARKAGWKVARTGGPERLPCANASPFLILYGAAQRNMAFDVRRQ